MVTAYREWQDSFDDASARPDAAPVDAETVIKRRAQRVAATTTSMRMGEKATATARRLNVDVRETEEEVAQRERQVRLESIDQFETRRRELVNRLDEGARRIEEARVEGKDVSHWETHWVTLLHRYEQTCDRIRELQAEL